MATKQLIVAICLMVAVLLVEGRSAKNETSKRYMASFPFQKKPKSGVDEKAIHHDAYLTTVRDFHFIMITKEEIVAV
jgi:hypothetical protein